MPAPDHSSIEIYIWKMLVNRLPFLEVTNTAAEAIASEFILELMHEMETCLQVDADLPEGDPSRVGNEANYTVAQRSFLADILAVQLLSNKVLEGIAGTNGAAVPVETYIKKAGAGSAQVEFDQVDQKKSTNSMVMSPDKLMSMYKKNAIRKGIKIGCELVFLDDGGLEVSCVSCDTPFMPFIVVTDKC